VRILYIVTAYPRAPGDVITPWLVGTILRLRQRGIEVEVLAPSYRGLGDQLIEGIRVHRFRYAPAAMETLTHDQTAPDRIRSRPWYLLLVPGYLLAGSVAAARLARRGGFDVVHAFWPLPHGLFGVAARIAAGTPLVSTFFGVELTWLRSQLAFLSPLVRFLIRRSDAVTVISSHTAEEVLRLAPEVVVRIIPFGAAAEPVVGEAHLRRDRGPAAPFRLLFIGRLVERKGVEILLKAIVLLRREADVRLSIVGGGPLRSALEELAGELGLGDVVRFAGVVPDGELAEEIRGCDALVLPAIRDSKGDVEGLGVVLIEALLHLRPVVASRSGGIPDIVIDDSTGLLVPPGDVEALAGAVLRLIREPGLGPRLALEGAKFVSERFSWGLIIDRLGSLYEGLVTARREAGHPSGWQRQG